MFLLMTTNAMTQEEKRQRLTDGLQVAMALADDTDSDMRKLLSKLLHFNHEYRADAAENQRLYIGTSADREKWWEVRESKAGTTYCKCPNHAFKRSRNDDVCKHVVYALALTLEVPRTADFA
jgi:hypothetical protein